MASGYIPVDTPPGTAPMPLGKPAPPPTRQASSSRPPARGKRRQTRREMKLRRRAT